MSNQITTFMNKPMKWITVINAVDINTGELISPNLINNKKYEILKKTSTAKIVTIEGVETGKKTITWHCQPTQKRQFSLW